MCVWLRSLQWCAHGCKAYNDVCSHWLAMLIVPLRAGNVCFVVIVRVCNRAHLLVWTPLKLVLLDCCAPHLQGEMYPNSVSLDMFCREHIEC
jgi:hypothetical protein